MGKSAIILGASGLIGSQLMTTLLKSSEYTSIKAFVRKELNIKSDKLTQIITDFSNLDEIKYEIVGDVIFCCLGSTKKKTPDLKAYKKVDHDYPLFFAEVGQKNGVSQYHLISALGANSKSSNFYTKMKGETENDLKAISFPSIFIYQPSFLIGDRDESRPMEKIMAPVMSVIDLFLIGPLKKFQSIESLDVAHAMFNESIKNKRGIFVHESDKIKQLA